MTAITSISSTARICPVRELDYATRNVPRVDVVQYDGLYSEPERISVILGMTFSLTTVLVCSAASRTYMQTSLRPGTPREEPWGLGSLTSPTRPARREREQGARLGVRDPVPHEAWVE